MKLMELKGRRQDKSKWPIENIVGKGLPDLKHSKVPALFCLILGFVKLLSRM